jgi:glycosyltransferase involved in cell wall biosynthesis
LENFRTKYNPDGKKVVLYYGTFEPYQGIDLLINSAEILKQKGYANIHFLLVGGNDKQVSHYRQIVEKKELGNSFTFTGFMAPQFIPGITQLADVLVSPRMRGNNSPLKIYSYLRSGIPIVATNHLTHTQILNSEVAFLTDIDSNSFATGITSAIEHNQLRNKIVKNAKMLVNQKYSYKSYLQKTQGVIEKAIKGS